MAPLFLLLLAITYLTHFGALRSKKWSSLVFNLKHFTTAVIGLPLGYILISNFGVYGLIAISLSASIPSLIISLNFIKNKYGATLDWSSSLKILLSSIVAAIIAYVFIWQFNFTSWIQLIIGAIAFTFVYVFLILLTRAINISDIKNLRDMVSSLGPISKFVQYFLNIMEKIVITLKL